MPEFTPIRQPFQIDGVDVVHPPDRMPERKFPYALNARSVLEGTATSRPGYGAPVNAAPFDQHNVHSIRRMNNYLPGASPAYRRFVGAGTKLYSADAGLIDTGYSGNPLSMVLWRPDQSVEPWMYIGDSQRMRKCRMNGATQTNYQVGIAPPTVAPGIALSAPKYTIVDDFITITNWGWSGTVTGSGAAAPREIQRNVPLASIGYINYDTGSTGWANVAPTNGANDYHWIGVGARITMNGGTVSTNGTAVTWVAGPQFGLGWTGTITIRGVNFTIATVNSATSITITATAGTQTNVNYLVAALAPETVVVQETHTQVSASTISGIVYAAGTTGLCTIQAATPLAGLTRNSMVLLNSGGGTAEAVVVLSVAEGPDGLYSFQCVTVNNHAATETITGLASFRVYFAGTHATGENITGPGIGWQVTTGIGLIYKDSVLDLSQVQGRPMSPEDYLHISLWVDVPANLIEIRILLNVDGTDMSFASNYYYFPMRPADNSAALTGSVSSLQALQTAATNLIVGEVESAIPSPAFVDAVNPQLGQAVPDVLVPDSQQLFTGGSNWTEVMIPYSDLQRIGVDTTRSIANVNVIGIWVNCSGTVNCQASAWWVGGGYGPDTFPPTAQPLIYRYRYRSTLTGAKSQQSPATRSTLVANPDGTINGSSSGVLAYRQEVGISATLSTDPQVDQIDFERYGGVLNEWHYVGTTPNTGTPLFLDDYADDDIKTNPALETDVVLPFVSFDAPRTGICNVVGTQVEWVSGDHFSTSWAPGQEILINGIPYIAYGQPQSATALATVENVDVLNNVPFLVAEPTLIGQPLPYIIGPFDQGNFLLAWGDPRNPGVVYATKGGDPDSAPISYYLELSDPSEPIVGGVIWDNNAIVASTKRFWRISIDANALSSGQGNVLVKQELQVGRGLFAPWAICAGPLIWFLDEAGVPCATNGAQAVSIVEDDLRPLFPHDDVPGVAVNNLIPPNLSATTQLRMSYSNGKMKFFFEGTDGNQWTWIYDYIRKGWLPSQFNVQMNLAYWEEGESLDSELLCGQDGNVYQVGGFSDNGTPIPVAIYTPILNGGNPRTQKFWGDHWLDLDTQGVTSVQIQIGFNLFTDTFSAQMQPGLVGRQNYPLNINSSNGFLGQNAQAFVYWSSSTAAPVIYEWQPWAWDTGTVLRTSWVSLPTSHGVDGWQHLRDGYVPLLMPTAGTVDLIVTLDGQEYFTALNLPLTPTANLLQKLRIDFPPAKGLMFEYQIQSATPFLVFEKDLEIYTKSWGSQGTYVKVRPFADPAFVS
jgi:hypothetical protein